MILEVDPQTKEIGRPITLNEFYKEPTEGRGYIMMCNSCYKKLGIRNPYKKPKQLIQCARERKWRTYSVSKLLLNGLKPKYRYTHRCNECAAQHRKDLRSLYETNMGWYG